MNKPNGFGLAEVLISLFLSSLILTLMVPLYVNTKLYYQGLQDELTQEFEIRWVSDLLSDSIRRAGFTPCLGIEQLKTIDSRSDKQLITALSVNNAYPKSIQVQRMTEHFGKVTQFLNKNELFISEKIEVNTNKPILIADCEHAEVHEIEKIDKSTHGQIITLTKPLFFSYPETAYLGEWLEERWQIKINSLGKPALYYHLAHTDELSSFVQSLDVTVSRIQDKHLVKVNLGLERDKLLNLMVIVRG